jgi:hypothetical protein
MKKLRNSHILGRAHGFLRAWRLLAPGAGFYDMAPEQLEAKISEAEQIRKQIMAAETRLSGLRLKRDQTERALADRLIGLASSVRGDPDYGSDCPLYRAFGFVPDSENRSGRPRKPKP